MQAMMVETSGARSIRDLASTPAVRAEMLRVQCLAEQAFQRRSPGRAAAVGRAVGSALLATIAGASMYALAMAGVVRLDDPPRSVDTSNFVVTTIEESGG